jgi:outer membrane protein TolC
MKRIVLVIIAAAAFSAPASSRQKMSLSLEQAIATGGENNRALHSSLMRAGAADAKSSETNAARLPSLKLGASYTRLSDVPPSQLMIPKDFLGPNFPPQTITSTLSPVVLDNYSMRLSVQQPLFTGFRLQSSADAASYNAEAASHDYQKEKTDLDYTITDAYWTLFKANEFKKVIDENVEQIRAHLKDVQNLAAQGVVTKNEVLKVEVQLSNAQVLQIDAANNVRLSSISLCNLIVIPLNSDLELTSRPGSDSRAYGDVSGLIQQAIEKRNDVKSLDLRLKAGQSAVTAARSGLFPQVYLNGNYYYARPNSRIFPTQDEFKDTWDVSLAVSMDLWNWGATIDQADQAKAQLEQVKDAQSQLHDAIALEVTQSFLNLQQAAERITVSEQGVSQAQENYRITDEKFKSGLALNSDLLDAEAALLQAQWNHIQSIVDHELADARLVKALGGR